VQNGTLARAFPRPISLAVREVIGFARVIGAAMWGFVSRRRWLVVAALVATSALLVVLSLGRPKQVTVIAEPEVIETKFDEVTNLGTATTGSWFHRWTADANNVERSVPGLTLGTPPEDDSEPPESTRLTRRLDAVRSRQSKGAVLTGTIDTRKLLTEKFGTEKLGTERFHAAIAPPRQSSNAPLRPPARIQLPQTVDASKTALHSTPESVFR
jgi:hypothetical protein